MKSPITLAVLLTTILVAGPVRAAELPVIEINVTAPGLLVEEVEHDVAIPLELALAGLPKLRHVETRSSAGRVRLTAHFAAGEEMLRLRQAVRDRLANVAESLPAGCWPLLAAVPTERAPDLWLTLRSDTHSILELSRLAEATVRAHALRIPGVVQVSLAGTSERRVQIHVDPEKLAARALTASDLVTALRAAGLEQRKGRANLVPNVRVEAGLSPADELPKIVLKLDAGQAVYLGDVAVVQEGAQHRGRALLGERPVVAIGLVLAADADRSAVRAQILKARAELPQAVTLEATLDSAPPGGAHLFRIDLRWPASVKPEEIGAGLTRISSIPALRRALALAPDPVEQRPETAVAYCSCRGTDIAALRSALAELRDVHARLLDLSAQARYPVTMALTGPDLERLSRWGRRLGNQLEDGRLLADVDIELPELIPGTSVRIDREKAARVGVTVAQVIDSLSASVSLGGSPPIELRFGADGEGPGALKERRLRGPGGQFVPLGTIVEFQDVSVPSSIRRLNGRRAVLVTANLAPGATVEQARSDCLKIAEKIARELKLPDTDRVVPLNEP